MSFFTRMLRTPNPPLEPPAEQREISIADPAVLALFGSSPTLAGVSVTETSALGLSAVYRSVALIAGTIATLPLRTLQDGPGGTRSRVPAFLDSPRGPTGLTPYEWTETVLAHLLLHGNAYCAHIYGGAGQVLVPQPIHPSAVSVEQLKDGTKVYRVGMSDGKSQLFDDRSMTDIPALSTDGVKGLSPLALARQSWHARASQPRLPGTFNAVLADAATDVLSYYQHDSARLLGRQGSGTLPVGTDTAGLHFELDIPDTTDGRDLRELVSRGDLTGMSFGFVAGQEEWGQTPDGRNCARTSAWPASSK